MQTPHARYVRDLREALPDDTFRPVPSRALWLVPHVAVVAGCFALMAAGVGGLPLALALVLPIGAAFAGMAFVAHETLHGATIRQPLARRLIGWLAFAPVFISPRHWVAWHNRLHHGNTMKPDVDPDAYPTLGRYRESRQAQIADHISLGGRRVTGVFTLLFGLIGQSMGVLFSLGPKSRYLPRGEYALALLETAAALALWIGLGVAFGPRLIFLGWLVPMVIANVILMGYIVTNHALSSQTDESDPLLSSLSVTVPGWFERFSLQFGMHVEHHLFPQVSGRHAPRIRALLAARFPDRYRSLPLLRALRRLFVTGRIYKDAHTLIDPRTGVESATL